MAGVGVCLERETDSTVCQNLDSYSNSLPLGLTAHYLAKYDRLSAPL